MKKILSTFLAFIMAVTCVAGVDFTACAADNDAFTYKDETGVYTEQRQEAPEDVSTHLIGTTFIKLSFSAPYNSDYDGIQVLKYNPATKKYVLLATLASTAEYYRAVDLKANTSYKFAVRGYVVRGGKKYAGKVAYITSRTAPAKTSITSVKYVSEGKMQVKWKKVSGVSGYVIKYSPSSSIGNNSTTSTVVVSGENTTSKTISGLNNKKYYVKVCTYKSANTYKYCSLYSAPKSVTVKKGMSMKSKLNAIKTDTSGRKQILEYTDNGVDISKYSTTYGRFKAIYDWHSKHNTDYGWSCMDCNINFNRCIALLFQSSNKTYDTYIYLAAGNFKNADGSEVMHKWSVIYIAGTGYIFDPRLQGYTGNKTGTDYFGITRTSSLGKRYLFDYYMIYWNWAKDKNKTAEHLIQSEVNPAQVKVKSISAVNGGFKLSWNTVSSGKGYQIIYSTDKNFSNKKVVNVDGIKTASKTVRGLKSGKTYYVRIRAYKQYGKSKFYGSYSAVKTVKAK